MVQGYMCEQHGYQRECDNDAGQRTCPECGNAVTGIAGANRGRNAPPKLEPNVQEGDIRWLARCDNYRTVVVSAFDFAEAAERAAERVDNPQQIREITPERNEYRARAV